MAEQDRERYQKAVNTYYKEELALMCQGHAPDDAKSVEAPHGLGDGDLGGGGDSLKKLDAAAPANLNLATGSHVHITPGNLAAVAAASQFNNPNKQAIDLLLQQQQMLMSLGQGGHQMSQMNQLAGVQSAMNTTAANNFLQNMQQEIMSPPKDAQTQGMPSSSNKNNSGNDDLILNMLIQHHQSTSTTVPQGVIMQLILNQKNSIKQQKVELMKELRTLELKNALLDTMLAQKEVWAVQVPGTTTNGTTATLEGIMEQSNNGNISAATVMPPGLSIDQISQLMHQSQNQMNATAASTSPSSAMVMGSTHGGQAPAVATVTADSSRQNPVGVSLSVDHAAPTAQIASSLTTMPPMPGVLWTDQLLQITQSQNQKNSAAAAAIPSLSSAIGSSLGGQATTQATISNVNQPFGINMFAAATAVPIAAQAAAPALPYIQELFSGNTAS